MIRVAGLATLIVATLIAFPGIGLAYALIALVALATGIVGDRLVNPSPEVND